MNYSDAKRIAELLAKKNNEPFYVIQNCKNCFDVTKNKYAKGIIYKTILF